MEQNDYFHKENTKNFVYQLISHNFDQRSVKSTLFPSDPSVAVMLAMYV